MQNNDKSIWNWSYVDDPGIFVQSQARLVIGDIIHL